MAMLLTADELATLFFISFNQQIEVIGGKAKNPSENPEFEKLVHKLQEQFPGLLTPFIFVLNAFVMALMDTIAVNNLAIVGQMSQEKD